MMSCLIFCKKAYLWRLGAAHLGTPDIEATSAHYTYSCDLNRMQGLGCGGRRGGLVQILTFSPELLG